MRRLASLVAFAFAACGTSAATLADVAAKGSPEDARAVISLLEDHRTGTAILASLGKRAEPDVRAAAVLALGRNEDPAGLPALVAALQDADAHVRRTAVFAMGQLGDAASERPLIMLLEGEPHPAVRLEVWRALGRIGGEPTLTRASKAKDLDRVPSLTAVALVLRRMNRRFEDVTWLQARELREDPEVRAAIFYILSRSPAGPIPVEERRRAASALASDDATERETAVRVLARSAEDAVAEVQAALRSLTLAPHQLAALAGGLGKAPGDDATDTLLGMLAVAAQALAARRDLTGPELHVALAAARALEGRALDEGRRKRVRDLLAALDGARAPSDSNQRRWSRLRCALGVAEACDDRARARLLGKPGGDLPALRKLTASVDPGVRMAALEAVAATGAEVTADLRAALADPDLPVAATAAGLLEGAKATDPATVEGLVRAFDRAMAALDLEAAGSFLTALAGIGGAAAEAACERAVASGQLALARIGADGLEALRGARPPIPRAPVPPFDGATLASYRLRPTARELTVTTELGDIVMRLETELAPRTVAWILELAGKKFYDGLTFHRVVPDFVIQGGDPRGDGWGGPGRTLRCENNPLPYVTGAVGMALAGKDTGGSQWFVTHSAQPHLYGTYTVFASVIRGQDVVDRIAEGDRILSIAVSD